MASDSSFLVYFRGTFTIDDAERALRATGMTVERDGDCVIARRKDGPELYVGLNAEDWVRLEALETAENHERPAIAECVMRYEVAFDDLEAVLDETNTLFEVQAALQDLTHGWILMSWNGNLIDPE
jgi:hypothetical protein